MATSSAIWAHATGASLQPNTAATSSATSNNASSATISANDFLTLLVTEMKNQDPTATTDPNEYINQLVNVNSLEQLISINQTLSSASGSTATTNSGASGTSSQANAAFDGLPLRATERKTAESAGSGMAAVAGAQSLAARSDAGNLGIPRTNPAAETIAHALARR